MQLCLCLCRSGLCHVKGVCTLSEFFSTFGQSQCNLPFYSSGKIRISFKFNWEFHHVIPKSFCFVISCYADSTSKVVIEFSLFNYPVRKSQIFFFFSGDMGLFWNILIFVFFGFTVTSLKPRSDKILVICSGFTLNHLKTRESHHLQRGGVFFFRVGDSELVHWTE